MTSPGLDRRLCWAPRVLFRESEGDGGVVDLERGTCFTLDPIGARVWRLIGEHSDLRRVLGALLAEFDVGVGQAEEELLRLIAEMEAHGLLRAAAEGSE